MAYWLFKTEPETFSLDDLKRLGQSPWDGVRNYQARNYLRAMRPGDQGLFYHSRVEPPGVVGWCRVVSEPFADATALDPESKYFDPKSTSENNRWSLVEVAYGGAFSRLISLEELRQHPKLQSMLVTRKGNRLSITPVTADEWKVVMKLAGVKPIP